jgi:glycosyltransferase involved in cell wall biosynthesis
MTEPTRRNRIVMDVTSLCCWEGHPTGIVRVERELATWARNNLSNVEFAFFDPERQIYRQLNDWWLDALLAGRCVVDQRGLPDASRTRIRFVQRIPRPVRSSAMWVLQFQRQLLLTLEQLRLAAGEGWANRWLDRLQRGLMKEKYRRLMVLPDGSRRPFLRVSDVLGSPTEFAADDVLLSAGSAWTHSNIAAVENLKHARGIRYAILCYDIIVLQFPQYWRTSDLENFRRHFHRAFPAADLVMFTARVIEFDARAYCQAHGLALGRTAIVPLGADPVRQVGPASDVRTCGLEPGKYVLFVSTIEPRKGHRMLLQAWRTLKQKGVTQAHGFQLALVGRPGWLVDDLMADLAAEQDAGSLQVLSDVDDGLLGALYRDCAFCVFPSEYEGYGLPVVEAFQYGKAVIASTGGAVPELVGDLMPCLDATDTDAWTETIGLWISRPDIRLLHEGKLRAHYRPMTWQEASARVFDTLQTKMLEEPDISSV